MRLQHMLKEEGHRYRPLLCLKHFPICLYSLQSLWEASSHNYSTARLLICSPCYGHLLPAKSSTDKFVSILWWWFAVIQVGTWYKAANFKKSDDDVNVEGSFNSSNRCFNSACNGSWGSLLAYTNASYIVYNPLAFTSTPCSLFDKLESSLAMMIAIRVFLSPIVCATHWLCFHFFLSARSSQNDSGDWSFRRMTKAVGLKIRYHSCPIRLHRYSPALRPKKKVHKYSYTLDNDLVIIPFGWLIFFIEWPLFKSE
jgi:hypothetical protein